MKKTIDKIGTAAIRLLIYACLLLTTPAVFGQVVYTWTGAGDGSNIVTAGNWTPAGGPPSGTSQDTGQWDGVTNGNVLVTYNTGLPGSGFNTIGVNWNLTANQTNSVTIIPVIALTGNFPFFGVNVAAGAGTLTLGNGTANQLLFIGRPAGAVHPFVNNSTNAVIINPNVQFQAGGGNAYTIDFSGTGNWAVTNNVRNANSGAGPITVQLDTTGTFNWAAGGANNIFTVPAGQVVINSGTMVIRSPGLVPASAGNNIIVNNGTLLKLDEAVPTDLDTITRTISGAGPLQVNSGSWTFSGANTYTGSNILSGGELVAAVAENAGVSGPLGVGGTISFTGGTLGFSVNNTFDYSSRFDTVAGQAYSFDTGGQLLTFATGLGSTGGSLAKVGPGTLTLAGASSYSGATIVGAGKLAFQGGKTGSGGILVSNGAALGITAAVTPVTPVTLTLGTSGSTSLEFNNVNSTATAPLVAGTLASAGTVTVNINSGTFTPGQSYPLLTWTTGPAPTVALGTLNGFIGNLTFAGNTLLLNITATAYKWTGLNNGNWDLATPNNWVQNGAPVVFANGGPTLFDDTAGGATNVAIVGVVQPSSLTINNDTTPYSIASSVGNDLGGSSGLTKSGNGTLVLSGGANAYTGVTTVSGGTLSVGTLVNGGSASDIGSSSSSASSLVFNGGTLQYLGGAVGSDRLFTLTTGGGVMDASGAGALNLNNPGSAGFSGTGARVLTLAGTNTDNNTLGAVLGDNGGATSLTKNGVGKWILGAGNTYSGLTTINNGTLQIGAGGASGSPGTGNIVDNSSLDFNRTGTLTVNGIISGSGSVTNDGTGTVVLAANNTYTGGTTVNAGTLQIGNGGATGALDGNNVITNNSTLIFNSTGTVTLNGTVNGTGQLIKRGAGLLKLLGNNTYTGGTTIDAGAQLQIGQGAQGFIAAQGTITNNGSLIFVRQDNAVLGITNNIIGTGSVTRDVNNPNAGDVTLVGTNTYTGGTFIRGGALILGDGLTPGAGAIVGNVVFTNSAVSDTARTLVFNRPDDVVFGGLISGAGSSVVGNSGIVFLAGSGKVTLTANNTYPGGTLITNLSTLQVGAGGTSGAIGTNNVTDDGVLIFNRSDSLTFGGLISGLGSVVQQGAGILTLTGMNANTGSTTVSNGTLVVSSVGGDLNVSGGTLAPGGLGSVGILTVGGGVNIAAGTVLATLNKALSQSNSLVSAIGAITYTGGTLKLTNAGPNLVVGNQFTLFNQPVAGGAAMPIVSPGYTFANNLAVDGSITVTSVVALKAPTLNTITLSGTNVIITATNNTGSGGTYTLLGTNNIAAPLTNWPVISTGTFDANGNLALTNAVGTNRQFFILRVP